MNRIGSLLSIAAMLTLPVVASGQGKAKSGGAKGPATAASPTAMPAQATGRCGDSTWTMAGSQQGACSNHGGVAKWIGKRPRGATARCNDGEYLLTDTRQGACSGHGGVATWYAKGKSK